MIRYKNCTEVAAGLGISLRTLTRRIDDGACPAPDIVVGLTQGYSEAQEAKVREYFEKRFNHKKEAK